jgi:hypothetical protein
MEHRSLRILTVTVTCVGLTVGAICAISTGAMPLWQGALAGGIGSFGIIAVAIEIHRELLRFWGVSPNKITRVSKGASAEEDEEKRKPRKSPDTIMRISKGAVGMALVAGVIGAINGARDGDVNQIVCTAVAFALAGLVLGAIIAAVWPAS